MGIFDFFRKPFINVIEWTETGDGNVDRLAGGTLAYRYPMKDRDIQNGAQLIVRESQIALLVNEGEFGDLFESGRHTLSTQNLPILTNLKNWDKGFQSPFKSDVYFFSIRDQIDQRWGTATPIVVRDAELGPVPLRAHGTYSYRIRNPKTFYSKISGTRDRCTTQDIEGQLRSVVLTHLSVHFGSNPIHFIDMSANQNQLSRDLQTAVAPAFEMYGLQLQTFLVQSISLPDDRMALLGKKQT
jgi:membrane protease subunit (stomatin/prohibitin family)